MAVLAQDVSAYLASLVTQLMGDGSRALHVARAISQPEPGALSYLKPGYAGAKKLAAGLKGMCVICSLEHAHLLVSADVTCLVAENPRLVFMRAVTAFFSTQRPPAGIHPRAVVDPSAIVHTSASIGANSVISAGCTVGPRSIIHPNVTLLDNVRVGSDVVINSGTVIGADGFGYERNEANELEKFPHIGGVVIEDGVEIGSNTSIDRGTLGDTIIRTGARIDNQCHISHNVEIGRHVAVIAQSMVGGSAVIGDYSWLAPAAIILNQVRIGTNSTVGMGAIVVKAVPAGQTVMGSPAVPSDEFRAQRAAVKKLLDPTG